MSDYYDGEDTFVIQAPTRERYVPIDYTTVRDIELTWAETGLLSYLLTLPKDWCINIEHLCTQKSGRGTGRDGTTAALRGLERRGYARKVQVRDKKGAFVGHRVQVRERLCDPWLPISGTSVDGADSPAPGEPTSGKPVATKEQLSTKERWNERRTAVEKSAHPPPFEGIERHEPSDEERTNARRIAAEARSKTKGSRREAS